MERTSPRRTTMSRAATKPRPSRSWSDWQAMVPRWSSRSAPAGSRCHSRRGVRVDGVDLSTGDGRATARQARWRPDRRHDRRLRRGAGPRHVPPDLRRLQHAVQPADPGRPGALLRERRRPSRRRRLLRGRGGLARAPCTDCATTSTSTRRPIEVDASKARRAPARPGNADDSTRATCRSPERACG